MPARKKTPGYLLHRASGQARVLIDGKTVYLGPFGSEKSKKKYESLLSQWLAVHGTKAVALTIDDLCLLYVEFAKTYYVKDDVPTTEICCIRVALRALIGTCGRELASEFSPSRLKATRDAMIGAGLTRKSINGYVSRIRRMYRWAVEQEYVPPSVWQALCAVQGLRKGRSKAVEPAPVQPVTGDVVDATLPHLAPVVADMVRLQLLCGARPGEVCVLRPADVTIQPDGVWVYRPMSHKTEHHSKERRIFIGPKAQEILRPYLSRDAEAFCFSPREAVEQHRERQHEAAQAPRRPDQKRIPKPTPRKTAHERYTSTSYCRAIARACEWAFEMPTELRKIGVKLPAEAKAALRRRAAEWRAEHVWSPNQLRHSRATQIRERFGIEAAGTVLGHSGLEVTQIYAEKNFGEAARIMKEIG